MLLIILFACDMGVILACSNTKYNLFEADECFQRYLCLSSRCWEQQLVKKNLTNNEENSLCATNPVPECGNWHRICHIVSQQSPVMEESQRCQPSVSELDSHL
jgi:hypothetical protein